MRTKLDSAIRVTLLAGPFFLHINTLARPAVSTLLARGKGFSFFLILTISKVDSARRVPVLFRDNFSPYKQGLSLLPNCFEGFV